MLLILMSAGLSSAQSLKSRTKKFHYQEVDFEDMIRRYFGKEIGPFNALEGIYSVSCVITKRYKPFLSNRQREKVLARKDNYAKVAILKDWPGSKRDYIEVSLSYRDPKRYPVVGELSTLSEGRGLIYNHIEPDASVLNFSMTNETSDILEAEYSFTQRKAIITYKVSYLKIYPKTNDLLVDSMNK
jgi:hypothetical protein